MRTAKAVVPGGAGSFGAREHDRVAGLGNDHGNGEPVKPAFWASAPVIENSGNGVDDCGDRRDAKVDVVGVEDLDPVAGHRREHDVDVAAVVVEQSRGRCG